MKDPFIYFAGTMFLSCGVGSQYGEPLGCIVFGILTIVYYFKKD